MVFSLVTCFAQAAQTTTLKAETLRLEELIQTTKPICNLYEPDLTLQIASLKIRPEEDVSNRIKEILSDKPELDLIVTSEYSLWKGSYNEQTPRIRIDCEVKVDGNCLIEDMKNGGSIIEEVEEIKELAYLNNVNIILGTLPTQELVETPDPDLNEPLYNTLVVINRQGNLIGKKMKTKGSDWCIPAKNGKNNQCWIYGDIHNETREKALSSSRTFTLTSKSNEEFTVFTSICLDLDDEEMIKQGAGSNADLLIWTTETGADEGIEEITSEVQMGGDLGWGFITGKVIEPYVEKHNTIRDGGVFIVADRIQSGLINLKQNPIDSLEITKDFVYGIIELQDR